MYKKLKPSEKLIRDFARSGEQGIEVKDFKPRTMQNAMRNRPKSLSHIRLIVLNVYVPRSFLINDREVRRDEKLRKRGL